MTSDPDSATELKADPAAGHTPEPAAGPADENRRRLTREECLELLDRPVAGVLSTLAKGGWIHSVPVHYRYLADEVRVLVGRHSAKARNVMRTGHGTLCVEVTDGPVRSFVSVSGPVELRHPLDRADLVALDQRYSRDDSVAGWDAGEFDDEVMLILHTDRWIAWSDWD